MLQKSEFAVQVLGFEKLGLELDNCGLTTKNVYCRIYSLCRPPRRARSSPFSPAEPSRRQSWRTRCSPVWDPCESSGCRGGTWRRSTAGTICDALGPWCTGGSCCLSARREWKGGVRRTISQLFFIPQLFSRSEFERDGFIAGGNMPTSRSSSFLFWFLNTSIILFTLYLPGNQRQTVRASQTQDTCGRSSRTNVAVGRRGCWKTKFRLWFYEGQSRRDKKSVHEVCTYCLSAGSFFLSVCKTFISNLAASRYLDTFLIIFSARILSLMGGHMHELSWKQYNHTGWRKRKNEEKKRLKS